MSYFWKCPSCQLDNLTAESFCKRCGGKRPILPAPGAPETVTPVEAPAPQKSRLWLWIVLVLIFCAAAGSAGYYFWNKQKEKKDAQAYIQHDGTAFGAVLAEVNGLSTDKDLTDSTKKAGDSLDVFLKKAEDESAKSEQALVLVRTTKTENAAVRPGQLVAGVDTMIKGYYPSLEEQVDKYNSYLAYETQSLRISKDFMDEMDKTKTIFRDVQSPEELGRASDSVAKSLDTVAGKLEALTPPAGLEDSQKKYVSMVRDISKRFSDLSTSIQEKDMVKLQAALAALDSMDSDMTQRKQDVEDVEKYYFEQMHSRFVELQKNADTVKTEITRAAIEQGTPVPVMTIEGW